MFVKYEANSLERTRFCSMSGTYSALRWRHNDHAGVSNHQPRGCLLNRLFRRKSKKTSKLRVTGLCAGNSPGTGEFPAQMASYAENVSIWWRHHGSKYWILVTDNNIVQNQCAIHCMWESKRFPFFSKGFWRGLFLAWAKYRVSPSCLFTDSITNDNHILWRL